MFFITSLGHFIFRRSCSSYFLFSTLLVSNFYLFRQEGFVYCLGLTHLLSNSPIIWCVNVILTLRISLETTKESACLGYSYRRRKIRESYFVLLKRDPYNLDIDLSLNHVLYPGLSQTYLLICEGVIWSTYPLSSSVEVNPHFIWFQKIEVSFKDNETSNTIQTVRCTKKKQILGMDS